MIQYLSRWFHIQPYPLPEPLGKASQNQQG